MSVGVEPPGQVLAGEWVEMGVSFYMPGIRGREMILFADGLELASWEMDGADRVSVNWTVEGPAYGVTTFRAKVIDDHGREYFSDPKTMTVVGEPNIPHEPEPMSSLPAATAPAGSEPVAAVSAPNTGIPLLDSFPPPAQTAQMPTGRAPTVTSINLPEAVFAGSPFSVTSRVEDPDGDLAYMTIRWQGHGAVDTWDIQDNPYPTVERRSDVIAPESGPLYFRVEVRDKQDNGYTSEWRKVEVIEEAAPSPDEINQWLTIERSPTSNPGQYFNFVKVVPGAPQIISIAADQANAASASQGGFSPQQLYNTVAGLVARQTLEADMAGLANANLAAGPAITGTATQTIVAYEGTQPVMQQIASDGTVQQWTQTVAGATAPITVPVFGQYVAPAAVEIPNNLGQAINETNNSGLPPAAGQVQDVATTVPVATFDPTHRLSGWDANGNEVYHLTEEGGHLVEWSVLSGHDSREMIPGSFHYVTDQDPTHVTSLTPPGSPGGSVAPSSATSSSASSSKTNTLLLIGGAGLLAWWLAHRRGN